MVRAEDVKNIKISERKKSILPFLKAEAEKEKTLSKEQNKKSAPRTKIETPEERLARENPDLLRHLEPPSGDELRLRALLED